MVWSFSGASRIPIYVSDMLPLFLFLAKGTVFAALVIVAAMVAWMEK
jgi:hypothetical protein